VVEAPTTTIHDHSTHSHGPLPDTGTQSGKKSLFGFYLILFGVFILSLSYIRRKAS
jgi:hypothetical protein